MKEQHFLLVQEKALPLIRDFEGPQAHAGGNGIPRNQINQRNAKLKSEILNKCTIPALLHGEIFNKWQNSTAGSAEENGEENIENYT